MASAEEDAARARLERELAYYRGEYNQLGARLLRLQEEQSQAFREARRSRTAAKLIREAISRLADTSLTIDELEGEILEIIVDNTVCDRAAFVREEPPGCTRFVVTHAIGLDAQAPRPVYTPAPPPFPSPPAETPPSSQAADLVSILDLPYVLWAYDAVT